MEFLKFIWYEKKKFWWFAIIAIILQFVAFKLYYPYPNFRQDSSAYITAAIFNLNVGEWPVGYSKFLRLTHFISHSSLFLVVCQYILLEAGAFALLATLLYWLRPGKYVFLGMFVCLLFNPIYLHLANYIMSDGLFTAMSFVWFTLLIWLIYKPSAWQIALLALISLLLLTVRYNAMFYPLIAFLAILLSPMGKVKKLAGITFILVLLLGFVAYTEQKIYSMTRTRQFSPFGGWQLANNALYMYCDVPQVSVGKAPEEFKVLDSLSRIAVAKIQANEIQTDPQIKDFFIWHTESPLWQFMNYKWRGDTSIGPLGKWISMGDFYSGYGKYLIKKYPGYYFSSFVLPNMGNFFTPRIADLELYNRGSRAVEMHAAWWFGFKQTILPSEPPSYEIYISRPYPWLILLSHLFFMCCVAEYILFKEYKSMSRKFNSIIILLIAFWILNFGFSSSATTVEIRYQIFQMALNFCFVFVLLANWVKKTEKNASQVVEPAKATVTASE